MPAHQPNPIASVIEQVDPFTVEVIRNALSAAAEEMSAIVMRSARSPLLREAGDLSSVLTDAEGALIAQGHDVPVHLGVLGYTVRAVQRCRLAVAESALQHRKGEVRRLIARGIPEPAIV